jgi:hypothetical protein
MDNCPPPLKFSLFQSGGEKIFKTRLRPGQKNKKKMFFIAAAKPPQRKIIYAMCNLIF